ncbi:MAG TPA: FkbM family methyltransferase [Solirubrobacteraceae bacterium]|nr:FkbM family methyltransferase [Solirubrobacteraceae bacterium]
MVGAGEKPLRLARRLAGHRRLLPLTALLLRGRTVRPTPAFVARALLRRRGTFAYTLRENGLKVAIRHGTGDVVTLGEVFHERDYEPPQELREQLAGVRRIVDLGGNVGLFGAFAAARWPHAEIVAFEPDPDNADVHEQTIALNELRARWRLVRAAAGPRSGRARFVAGAAALSRLADANDDASIEVAVEDVVPRLARADLVKIDIEGAEWPILADPRFREGPPGALVLEYHPRFCPTDDPRAAAESALTAAGLRVRNIWERADGHGMLWAWRS